MLKINENEIQELCRHAEKEYPKECCGILLGNKKTGSVQKIYRAGNVADIDRQNTHFLMNPLELYRVEREADRLNMEIVGFYHSHADYPAVLSVEDGASMIQGCIYMVISVMNGICRDIKCFMKKDFQDDACEIQANMKYRQAKRESQ